MEAGQAAAAVVHKVVGGCCLCVCAVLGGMFVAHHGLRWQQLLCAGYGMPLYQYPLPVLGHGHIKITTPHAVWAGAVRGMCVLSMPLYGSGNTP